MNRLLGKYNIINLWQGVKLYIRFDTSFRYIHFT